MRYLVALLLLVVLAAVVLWYRAANRLDYFYPWGRIYGVKIDEGLRPEWRFGMVRLADSEGALERLALAVDLGGGYAPLETVTEALVVASGAQRGQTSGGRSLYWIGGSSFLFRSGKLVEWRYGPIWSAKDGPRYASDPKSRGYQFPLSEEEVRALFGSPTKSDRSLEIH